MFESNLEKKYLIRSLEQVKKISSAVNINTYYWEIKPFLFGTSSPTPIKEEDLDNVGGIYQIAKDGEMPNGGTTQILINTEGSSPNNLFIPEISSQSFITQLDIDENGNREKYASHYLFPSDLVSILIAIAKIFYNSGYNQAGLLEFAKGDNLSFVGKWGEATKKIDSKNTNKNEKSVDEYAKKGVFKETTFLNYSSNIAKLLSEVKNAAIEFEGKYEGFSLEEFSSRTETQDRIIKEIAPNIFDNFIKDIKDLVKNQEIYELRIKPILEINSNFISDNSATFKEKLELEIEGLIRKKSLDFFRSLFSSTNLSKFEDDEIYKKERDFFLFTIRESDQKSGLKETNEYADFIEESIKNFLEQNQSEFIQKYIIPFFPEVTKKTTNSTETETEIDESGGANIPDEEEPLESAISQEDFKARLSDEINEQVYSEFFEDYTPETFRNDRETLAKIEEQTGSTSNSIDFSRFKDEIESNHSDRFSELINQQTTTQIINNFAISESELEQLKEFRFFLNESFDLKIFESDWYKQLLSNSIETVKSKSTDENYSTFFEYLYSKELIPDILKIVNTEDQKQDDTNNDEDESNSPDTEQPSNQQTDQTPPLTSATVPGETETKSQPQQTKPITVAKAEINVLSPDKIRELQYESAWMYNRAVYELYTSKGMDISDIPSQDLLNLQSDIFNFTASMNGKDFNKLFGSAAFRQKALMEFYLKSGKDIKTFSSSKDLLSKNLKDSFSDTEFSLDAPQLDNNIKEQVDSWIIQYGLNEDLYGFDPKTQTITTYSGNNKHDIIWFLDNIPPDRLGLIFGIPTIFMVANHEKFKQILKNYAKCKGSEQNLHILNDTLQNGLVTLTPEQVRQIEDGDEKTILEQLSFTRVISAASKSNNPDEDGAATLAGAVSRKKSDIDKTQKQYKTFVPLWDQLTGAEQLLIYQSNRLPIPPGFEPELEKLDFIQEFITFDVSKFETIKNILNEDSEKIDKPLSKEEQQELRDIVIIQKQAVKEYYLAIFLAAKFKGAPELEESATFETFQKYPNIKKLRNVIDTESFAESFVKEQKIEQENDRNQTRLSRFRNSFRKGKSKAFDKAKNALKSVKEKVATKLLKKGLEWLANSVTAGLGTAIKIFSKYFLSDKTKKFIKKFLQVTLGASAAYTLYRISMLLSSLSGILSLTGGIIGFAIGNVPGMVGGAFLGNRVGTSISNNILGGTGPETTRIPTKRLRGRRGKISTAENASTIETMLNSYEGISVLAAGGFSVSIIFITLFIVIIIQSAFLIPIPQDRLTTGFTQFGNEQFNCEKIGKPLPFNKNTISPIAERAYDIVNDLTPGFWCYWNWHPDYDGLGEDLISINKSEQDLFDEELFKEHPNHCVYSKSHPENCTGNYKNFQNPNQLFWCTWLINKAYQNNYSTHAFSMGEQFKNMNGHKYTKVESITWKDVKPGDVAFIKVLPLSKVGHVAIVHNVGQDFITTVDSNAYSRYNQYTVGDDGKIQATKYLKIDGFGRRTK